MQKMYRKKPVVISARGPIEQVEFIETLEGRMKASVGDYVITGVQGEQYPCRADIFDQTYEPFDGVEQSEDTREEV